MLVCTAFLDFLKLLEPPDSSPIPVIAGAAGGGLVLIAVAIFVIIVYR